MSSILTRVLGEILGNGDSKQDPLPPRPELPDEKDAGSFEQKVTLGLVWSLYSLVSFIHSGGLWARRMVRAALWIGSAAVAGGGITAYSAWG